MYENCMPLQSPYINGNIIFWESSLSSKWIKKVYLWKLVGYDYIISYKLGKPNTVVDALSKQEYTAFCRNSMKRRQAVKRVFQNHYVGSMLMFFGMVCAIFSRICFRVRSQSTVEIHTEGSIWIIVTNLTPYSCFGRHRHELHHQSACLSRTFSYNGYGWQILESSTFGTSHSIFSAYQVVELFTSLFVSSMGLAREYTWTIT